MRTRRLNTLLITIFLLSISLVPVLAATIVVDGDISDWATIGKTVVNDDNGDGTPNVSQIQFIEVTNDTNNFYFHIANASQTLSTHFCFDLDTEAGTGGCSCPGSLGGFDYVFEMDAGDSTRALDIVCGDTGATGDYNTQFPLKYEASVPVSFLGLSSTGSGTYRIAAADVSALDTVGPFTHTTAPPNAVRLATLRTNGLGWLAAVGGLILAGFATRRILLKRERS